MKYFYVFHLVHSLNPFQARISSLVACTAQL